MPNILRFISKISRISNRYRDNETAKNNMDISGNECKYLLCICHHEGLTQEQISKIICVDKSNVARKISSLEQKGYIMRKPMETDKRNLLVYATEKAKAEFPLIKAINQKWEEYLLADFSDEEKEVLVNLIAKIKEKADKWNETKEI